MIDWHISLIVFYVLSVSKALAQRRYLRTTSLPSSVVAAMNFIFAVWPLALIAGLTLPHEITWSPLLIALLIVDGLAIGLYNNLSFRAIKRLPISHYQTLEQSFNVFVILGGWMLLNETLSVLQIIGACFIISAAMLSGFATKSKAKKLNIPPGTIRLVLLAAIVLSIGLIAEKAVLGHMQIGGYFIVGIGAQALFVSAIALKDINKKTMQSIKKTDIKAIIGVGVLSAFSGFLYLYTLNTANNISLIISLASFVLPLTAFASYWFLKERENRGKLWGSIALGVIGICLTVM